jgi:chemotaxis signal transduction protein
MVLPAITQAAHQVVFQVDSNHFLVEIKKIMTVMELPTVMILNVRMSPYVDDHELQ